MGAVGTQFIIELILFLLLIGVSGVTVSLYIIFQEQQNATAKLASLNQFPDNG